jgi:hypothetical protein
MVRGTLPGMWRPGTILGHEGVVEEVGQYARNLRVDDRVVIGLPRPRLPGLSASTRPGLGPSPSTPTRSSTGGAPIGSR